MDADSVPNIVAGDRYEKQRTEWLRYLSSQVTDLKVQVEIARYAFLASSAKDEIMGYTHDFFRDTFYLPIESGVEATQNAVKEIAELKLLAGIEKKWISSGENSAKNWKKIC